MKPDQLVFQQPGKLVQPKKSPQRAKTTEFKIPKQNELALFVSKPGEFVYPTKEGIAVGKQQEQFKNFQSQAASEQSYDFKTQQLTHAPYTYSGGIPAAPGFKGFEAYQQVPQFQAKQPGFNFPAPNYDFNPANFGSQGFGGQQYYNLQGGNIDHNAYQQFPNQIPNDHKVVDIDTFLKEQYSGAGEFYGGHFFDNQQAPKDLNVYETQSQQKYLGENDKIGGQQGIIEYKAGNQNDFVLPPQASFLKFSNEDAVDSQTLDKLYGGLNQGGHDFKKYTNALKGPVSTGNELLNNVAPLQFGTPIPSYEAKQTVTPIPENEERILHYPNFKAGESISYEY